MPSKKQAVEFVLPESLLHAYRTNDRINHYLIRNLPPAAWRVSPPGGKGRTIAEIVAHMHNVRLMWLKSAAPEADRPAKLEGDFSAEQAIASLEASCAALHRLLSESVGTGGRIRGFKPDAGSFFAYLVAHDAHHRGQISMLARQAGHPLPQSAMYGMWEWGTR